MEQTLVLIKPDGIERGLVGEIISRYERKQLQIKYCRLLRASKEKLEQHYAEHVGKGFYDELVSYMGRGDLIAMVLSGENAIETVRKINGKTNPLEAEIGSIRGDFAVVKEENLVHSSDSAESAQREIKIWLEL